MENVDKLTVATCSLAGCFGCHMSFLDMDERIVPLIDRIRFDRSPLTDIKELGRADIGLIEGGLSNDENIHVAKMFRERCKIVVAVGACAINGGVPAMRNHLSLTECLEESYLYGTGIEDRQIPNDPELPLLLNKVHPVQDMIEVDYSLPGCPPPADAFFELLTAMIEGRKPKLRYSQRRFD